MDQQKEDVLTRLDTLLNPTEVDNESGPASNCSSNCSSTPSSILKTSSSKDKKKSIRFREDEDLQEVIGYGGGEDNNDASSDEDEVDNRKNNNPRFDDHPEELTIEEKNILNLTRQNTTFNAHAQNLNGGGGGEQLLRLGVDKKVTPLITVRPFGMRNEKAINKVQPMINGEVVVTSNKEVENSNSGRGESRALNSDGASSESSSSEDNDGGHMNVRPSSVIEREFFKAKQSAATARLSFLNSTIAFEAKGEPTTDIVSNWVKTPEDEDEVDEAAKIKKKSVKLTRKSPYVVGPYASTAILKGTPKPAISVRKPPVPAKPEKLLPSSSSSSSSSSSFSTNSSDSGSPIAAPRRHNKNEYANVKSEVTISADESTRIELSSSTSEGSTTSDEGTFAECYSVNADVKNAIILDVTASPEEEEQEVDDEEPEEVVKDDVVIIPEAPKLPKVQQNFNQMALEAIRKSLASKISVQEELTNKDDEDVEKIINKTSLCKSLSTNSTFEANRASVANALGFNRQDKVLRPSTKRQAPKPPEEEEVTVEEQPHEQVVITSKIPEPPPMPTEPLVVVTKQTEQKPVIKSSIKQESSPSSVVKSVQFNPETETMTLPVQEPDIQPISYNRWISRDPNLASTAAIVESSFTGQPIAVQGGHRPSLPPQGSNKKPAVIQQSQPTETDEIRKWTEKKKGSRSKSLPRGGSEIDEILGSSKTKPPSRLFPALVTSPPLPATAAKPVHRQSRVELYENDRKRMRQNSKFSSIKKLFKLGSNPNLTVASSPLSSENSPTAHSNVTAANRRNSISSNEIKFMDKEHEREILERERSKIRPEIIHPLDLQSGGVEVVKITPKSQTQALYEKNQKSKNVTKSILVNKTNKPADFGDSGHETSSIHTENSEGSHSSDSSSHQANNGTTTMIFTHHAMPPMSKNKLYSVGRAKPVPPPRSHSLEPHNNPQQQEKKQGEPSDVGKNDNIIMEEEEGNNKEAEGSSLPPNGYVVAGKMRLGSISVPAPNSAHLRRDSKSSQKLPPFRSESINSGSGSSSFLPKESVEIESISERESISPHRLLPHEENCGDEEDASTKSTNASRLAGGCSRLSVRNGRSVVHKNLEDNYGAVISANHEALAQILEQTSHHQRPEISKALKPLQMNGGKRNLSSIADFTFLDEAGCVNTKAGTFYAATYGDNKVPVTLLLSPPTERMRNAHEAHQEDEAGNKAFSLCPVTKFIDDSISKGAGGIVSVFGRLQVETLATFTKKLAASGKMTSSQSWEKEISFVLLQLTNGLKSLQAQGIEEIVASEDVLDHFLLIRADKDPHYRIIILDQIVPQEASQKTLSLCSAALAAMLMLFQVDNPLSNLNTCELPELTPSVGMFRSMADILRCSSSMALGQVKSMLEYMLWGPSDIAFEVSTQETREQSLQRWLDLERATVLHNLIRTQGLWRIHLTVFEEYHLLFLVQTCAKMLHEASLLFESEVACM